MWVEVKNDSADIYWLLPSGLDPNYFSPWEAAFAFPGKKEENHSLLDDKFLKLQFQNPVAAGTTNAGFVLANLDEGFKAIDIDIISQKDVKNYSFIITDPEFKTDHKEIDFESMYAPGDIVNMETEEELRRALEELLCCTTDSDGEEHGDPINLVLVGEVDDIFPALIRRNWHPTEVVWSEAIKRTIKYFMKGERAVTRLSVRFTCMEENRISVCRQRTIPSARETTCAFGFLPCALKAGKYSSVRSAVDIQNKIRDRSGQESNDLKRRVESWLNS